MPKVPKTASVGILLHKDASPTLALLMRDIFLLANRVVGFPRYNVELISARQRVFHFGPVSITASQAKNHYDYLLVTPVSKDDLEPDMNMSWQEECRLISKLHAKKTTVAAPCLGVLLLAQSGILDNVEATIHWGWSDFAQSTFPNVKWNAKNMLCQEGTIITAGGYLATVDLALHLISQSCDKKIAHEIGRLLLAESSREKQSAYAARLISGHDDSSSFYKLEAWIEKNLKNEITVTQLATLSNMSLRNFQRQFTESHGISPKSFIQLKRIEKAKSLLRDTRLSIEEIVEHVGVSDVSSFRKVFQREIGMTPTEFRRRIR